MAWSKEWQETHREIGDVRGLGAMIAIELFEMATPARKPNATLTADIVARAREGLILLSCGPYYNILRILVSAHY